MRNLYLVIFSLLFVVPCSFGAELVGVVAVNQTSDTAAKAKINAMNLARKQILSNILSKYSDKESLNEVLLNAPNDDLTNLISSSSVSGEHISVDSYSANITMTLDNDAVKKWLIENNVQNWLPSSEPSEKFTAFIVVPNGIVDWAELKRIARDENIEIETQRMTGNQIIAKMPLNVRTKFTAAVRQAGWKYADNDGVLQIWK